MSTPLRRIVAGIATLEPDDPALAPAVHLAERTDAELTLVHVLAEGSEGTRGGALRRLEMAVRALTPRDRITWTAVRGRAGDTLARLAAELRADLLVLGHTRRTGAAAAMLGTTAQRVLRSSTVPVLSLHGGSGRAPSYGRVLLATDLSPHSAHALRAGARLAQALALPAEPRLRPLFVSVASYEAVAAGIPDWSAEHASAELAEFLTEVPALAGLPAAVRAGDPAGEILAEAHEWQAELVVVGTHGRRGVPRLLLGSVAETVLRRASIGVLVIPPASTPVAVAVATGSTAEPRRAGPAPPSTVVESPPPPPAVASPPQLAEVPEPAARRRRRPPAVPSRCILAATDLSGASDHVLRSAASLAGATGAALHVIHAFDFASPVYMGRRLEPTTFQYRIAAAEMALEAQIARTVPPEVTVAARRVEVYSAHRAIAGYADAAGAELVVVGAHTHNGSHLGVLGSTADRLIRTLRVPVLVVRTELGLPLHRVVVPLDLSDPGCAALEIGVRWAGALGQPPGEAALPETEVAVVHVVPQLFAVADAPFDGAAVPPGLNRAVDAAVRAAGSPARVLVREEVRWNDRPATEIVSFAWRDRADLLVLATHGYGPVKRALIGGTASSVVRRAPCPVLLVPPALWSRRAREDAPRAREAAAV
ncbi:MAG: universal stress protein [Longimicrobiaceae bacterium]